MTEFLHYSENTTFSPNLTTTLESSTKPESLYTFVKVVGSLICIVCVFGVIANILNIYVLSRIVSRRTGVSPTYHLLIALGVADLMILLLYAIYAFSVFPKNKPLLYDELNDEHHDYYHVLLYTWYLPCNIFLMASNWCVVATTIFRFLAVAFPMKVGQWCTLTRMRISILCIYISSVAFTIPDWLTVEHSYTSGGTRINSTELYDKISAYYTVVMVFESLIPFTLNLLLVIFLILQLIHSRKNMTTNIQPSPQRDQNAIIRQREHRRIGVMLIAIVIWFLIFYTPSIIYILMRDYAGEGRSANEGNWKYQQFSFLKDLFMLCNHAGNVIFYCLCNQTYRRMFATTLLCHKKTSSQSQYTRSTLISSRNASFTIMFPGREHSIQDEPRTTVDSLSLTSNTSIHNSRARSLSGVSSELHPLKYYRRSSEEVNETSHLMVQRNNNDDATNHLPAPTSHLTSC